MRNFGPNDNSIDTSAERNAQNDWSAQIYRSIFIGTIVDVIQHLHLYEVSFDHGMNLLATTSSSTDSSHFGIKSYNSYTPGTRVICFKPPNYAYAYIVATVPEPEANKAFTVSDHILMQSRSGILNDNVHKQVTQFSNKSYNFNNSRPYDSYPGEVGWISPLGVNLHMGLMSTHMRASDVAGIWCFYLDNLVRLAAYNYQFWTAGREDHYFNDEGEYSEIRKVTSFPWEYLGVRAPGDRFDQDALEGEYTATGGDPFFKSGLEDARYEPQYPDQLMIPRYIEFFGYLGDIYRSLVVAPPSYLPEVERYSSQTNYHGLSEFTRHSNGLVEIQSTKGIRLEKTVFIPIPKQLKSIQDSEGESATDESNEYKFAGNYGEGDDHVKGEFEYDPEKRIAQLFDEYAWMHNYQGSQSFKRHSKDWHISVEAQLESFGGNSLDITNFIAGTLKFKLDLPESYEVEIDHREGHTHKYYRSKSSINLLDDGSVVTECGWGSQIVQREGNIYITCPGDIMFQPGRNMSCLAPNDINLRAGHCADISAGTGDLRLKADKNLHALAGNSGMGGLLLESRGEGFTQQFEGRLGTDIVSSGILLKTTNSPVGLYGSGVYIRSTDNGNVVLDADDARGTVEIYGSQLNKLIQQEITAFGVTPSKGNAPSGVEIHTGQSIILGQTGSIISKATSNVFLGDVAVESGLAASSVSDDAGSDVLPKNGPGFKRNLSTASSTATNFTNSLGGLASRTPSTGNGAYRDSQSLGQETLIENLGFSFRTDEEGNNQYGLDDFSLVESRWQQYFKLNDQDKKWDEPIVKSPAGVETMPFPGKRTWEKAGAFIVYTNQLWTPEDGDEDDLDTYDSFTVSANNESTSTFKDNYLINNQII